MILGSLSPVFYIAPSFIFSFFFANKNYVLTKKSKIRNLLGISAWLLTPSCPLPTERQLGFWAGISQHALLLLRCRITKIITLLFLPSSRMCISQSLIHQVWDFKRANLSFIQKMPIIYRETSTQKLFYSEIISDLHNCGKNNTCNLQPISLNVNILHTSQYNY